MDSSKIAVDLRTRTFEIEVPHDQVAAVLDRLESLFSLSIPVDDDADEQTGSPAAASDKPLSDNAGERHDAAKPDAAKKRGRSAAKPRSYKHVDLGLSSDEREKFRQEFEERKPGQQSDVVAVVGYQLKMLKGKSEFTPDEIHSAIKIVNRPTPKNLPAVFGNMKRDGIADYASGKVIVNSLTDDHVIHHMLAKQKKK